MPGVDRDQMSQLHDGYRRRARNAGGRPRRELHRTAHRPQPPLPLS